MNVHSPARRRWPGRLVNLAVVVVVLALAAATFVLSYSGVHAIVSQAGVSARFARIYPWLFDALFVVACVAAVVPRDARWWARFYAWLVIILVVAVVGAAGAVHAMNVTLPHRTMEGAVAAAPWVIVLLGFGLMLTVLRQSRAQHAADKAPSGDPAHAGPGLQQWPEAVAAPGPPALPPTEPVPETPSILDSLLGPEIPVAAFGEPVEFAESVEEEPVTASAPDVDPAWPAEEGHPPAVPSDVVGEETPPVTVPGSVIDEEATPFATAPFAALPRLNRVRSTPTPPEGPDDE